ncbi:MAG TPA: hypothetical protein VH108_05020, partial [Gaiellaceae bacterium]|nr:hypothetical protein [Gaiellaceae bacterium]
QRAASADVRSAIPATTLYYNDQTPNSYTGMTAANLASTYDAGLKLGASGGNTNGVNVGAANQTFCVWATIGGRTSYFVGPAGAGGVTEIGTAALPASCTAP